MPCSILAFVWITETEHQVFLQTGYHVFYGAPFVKVLYLTDLAQKLLSLRMFSFLCAEIAISGRI